MFHFIVLGMLQRAICVKRPRYRKCPDAGRPAALFPRASVYAHSCRISRKAILSNRPGRRFYDLDLSHRAQQETATTAKHIHHANDVASSATAALLGVAVAV